MYYNKNIVFWIVYDLYQSKIGGRSVQSFSTKFRAEIFAVSQKTQVSDLENIFWHLSYSQVTMAEMTILVGALGLQDFTTVITRHAFEGHNYPADKVR